MLMTEHAHVAVHVLGPFPFQGCCSTQCEPKAHHGRAYMHVCECGQVRIVNISKPYSELGAWHEVQTP